MLNGLLNFKTNGIGIVAGILAISALISQLLALARDRILAGQFGAGQELDVYFAAFRIPDFIFGILIMGGISAVFLPLFSEYFKKSAEQGWKYASNILNCFLILLISACIVLAIFTPQLVGFIAPGFNYEQKELLISLTRIMFLSPIFFGLSSIFSGIAHYFNRFLFYSIAPILYNLSIIFGVLFLVPIFGLYGLAYGVVLGALLHWLIQIPAAKISGFKYSPEFSFRSLAMKKTFQLMLPRTIGAVATHINLIVVTAIASTLAVGSITVLQFANNLQYIPITLIGASFAIASFPVLCKKWVDEQKQEFLKKFSFVFRQVLFLIIPISFLVFLLREQIVRVILSTGEFGWWETKLTAASLGIFSFGIFALAFIPFLVRVFFSFQNTKTPVKIGLFSVALNIIFCFLFIWLLGFTNIFQGFMISFLGLYGIENIAVIGLAMALSLSAIFQFFLLCFYLKKEFSEINIKEIWQSFKKIILATILMSIFVYFTLYVVGGLVNLDTFLGAFVQLALAGFAGILVYLLSTFLLKSSEIKVIMNLILKK